jgi:hypothetical protein
MFLNDIGWLVPAAADAFRILDSAAETMTLIYVKWRDAVNSNASHTISSLGELAELHEVGFLLKESEATITIGTEAQEGAVEARFWLTIPKANIIELRRSTLARAFPLKRVKKVIDSEFRG